MHHSIVLAARQVIKPPPHNAVALHQRRFFHGLQLADGANAVLLQSCGKGLADAPDHLHRLFGQEVQRLLLTDRRESARFVQVAGHFGEEFVVRKPNRNCHADFFFNRARKFGETLRWACVMQFLRARHVQKCFIDAQRFNGRGQLVKFFADLFAGFDIFSHPRWHKHSVWTQSFSLE